MGPKCAKTHLHARHLKNFSVGYTPGPPLIKRSERRGEKRRPGGNGRGRRGRKGRGMEGKERKGGEGRPGGDRGEICFIDLRGDGRP